MRVSIGFAAPAARAAASADRAAAPAGINAWAVFAVLFALMVVNYVDRQIVVSLFPHLKREWQVSDGELGMLVSIVSLVIAIGTLPLSIVADNRGRVRSVILMALVWNVATIGCAFAGNYPTLLAARGFIGAGEAAYGAVAAAIVTTLFSERVRSTMLAAFLAAGLVGSVAGVAIGGVIADRWSWHAAFVIAGSVGIALAALLALVARDPPRIASSRDSSQGLVGAAWRVLMRRTTLLGAVGGGLQLITVSTIFAWLPSYLNRFYGLDAAQSGLRTGSIIVLGAVGAVAFGVLADRLHRRYVRGRLHAAAAAAAVTAAALVGAFALFPPGGTQIALIVFGATAMIGATGPVATAVSDVAPRALRATALSILALVQNLVGLAVGPLLAGALSDRVGLQTALAIVPVASALAAFALVVAARGYEADVRRIEGDAVGGAHASRMT